MEFVIHHNLWSSVLGFVLSRDTDFYRSEIKPNIPKYQIPKSLQTGDWVRSHTLCFFRCSSFDVRLRFQKYASDKIYVSIYLDNINHINILIARQGAGDFFLTGTLFSLRVNLPYRFSSLVDFKCKNVNMFKNDLSGTLVWEPMGISFAQDKKFWYLWVPGTCQIKKFRYRWIPNFNTWTPDFNLNSLWVYFFFARFMVPGREVSTGGFLSALIMMLMTLPRLFIYFCKLIKSIIKCFAQVN